MTPEGELKKEVDKFLKSRGAYVFSPVQMGMGRRTVDRLICYKGHFIAVELKALGKEPTALQYKTIDDVLRAGGIAFWADNFTQFTRLWHLLADPL